MVKKLFALASVTALGGLVASVTAAGCSSTEIISQPGDAGLTDAKKTDAKPPIGDTEEEEAPSCKAKITFTPDQVNPPAPQSGTACKADVISALADACTADPNAQPCTDARALLANKTCAECIFGSKSDAQWKVINLMPGEKPAARYNQEGCVEHVTGVKGCGQSYLTVLGCFNDFCAKCDEASAGGCVEDVASAECKDYLLSDAACAGALKSREKEVDSCFPTAQDAKGIKDLFVYMSTVACATTPGGGAKDGG